MQTCAQRMSLYDRKLRCVRRPPKLPVVNVHTITLVIFARMHAQGKHIVCFNAGNLEVQLPPHGASRLVERLIVQMGRHI